MFIYIYMYIYLKYNYKLIIYLLYIYIYTKLYIHRIIYIHNYIIYIYIHNYIIYIYIYTLRMDQRYGTKVWNGSFKEVWNRGMERGYGTGVVPELVPDLLFWLAPIYIYIYIIYYNILIDINNSDRMTSCTCHRECKLDFHNHNTHALTAIQCKQQTAQTWAPNCPGMSWTKSSSA